MSSPLLQLLVLAGIAVFLILKLRGVLGTREGFEKPPAEADERDEPTRMRREFEVIEGGPDRVITDNVPEDSEAAKALAAMKLVEPDFGVTDFIGGARGAYEMILMAFENGELDDVRDFLSEEVFDAFVDVVGAREDDGLTVEAQFGGVREISIVDASFDRADNFAEISVRVVAELVSVVKNAEGDIIEGDSKSMKKQKDVWTFGRTMGSNDPNWQLVATGG